MALFDKASGVVYSETTSAKVGSMVPTWMSQARGKRNKSTSLKSRGKGCSSLQDMALRSCAYHVELFVPETLQWATWHYARRVHQFLVDNEALTYNAWNMFYDAYPDQIDRQQHFHVYEPNEWSYEPRQLLSINNRLGKLDTSVITLLCVRDFSLTFEHLKTLIKIPTLGALILEQARPSGISEITARQFTDFARAVREKDTFQKLKLLIMCDFGIGRKAILEGVAGWPALDLIGLQNSKATDIGDLLPVNYVNWNQMVPNILERHGLSSDTFDPESIWKSSYFTSSQKIQRLYDLTKSLEKQPLKPTEPVKDHSVCITYGGWTNRSIHEATTWYIRNLQVQSPKPPEGTQAVKRSQENHKNVTKKRRVRLGKQMDVGSLLGAFR